MGQRTCSSLLEMDSRLATHLRARRTPPFNVILTDPWAKYLLTCSRIPGEREQRPKLCCCHNKPDFLSTSFVRRSYRCEGGPSSNWFPQAVPWPIFCNLDFYLLSVSFLGFLFILLLPRQPAEAASSAHRKEVHRVCVKLSQSDVPGAGTGN